MFEIVKSALIRPCPRGCDCRGTVRDPLTGRRKLCPRCGGGRQVLVEVVQPVRQVAA